MSIAKELLLTEIDYSEWAGRQLLDACSALTEEEFECDLGASHGSAAGTLFHLYYSERVWMKRLCADELPPLVEMGDPKLFGAPAIAPGLESLKRSWPAVWEELRRWLVALPAEELGGEMCCARLEGEEFRIPRWKVVLHMVNHSTLHRGQVMGMLRSLGKQPPSTDLMTFYLLR